MVRQISSHQAATLQLSVPVIASLVGVLLLGEPISLRLTLISIIVLAGVGVALMPARSRLPSSDKGDAIAGGGKILRSPQGNRGKDCSAHRR
ncbi:hypothetical protein D3C78_1805030 [compost metagenome]